MESRGGSGSVLMTSSQDCWFRTFLSIVLPDFWRKNNPVSLHRDPS
jgi:hypothetical protein